jgi:phage terminase large subunit GpA-like protein
VMVVKGHSQPNRPVLGRPSKQDVRNDTGSMDKHGVQLWMVGTDTAKSTLFARLDGDADRPPADRMARFSAELPLRFFEGLTSEYYDTDTGRYIKRPGRRNEPLDTWVYAYAAAHRPGIAIHTARHADWDELERLYEPRVPDLFASLAPMPVTGTADQTQADAVPEQDPQPARQTAADTPAVIAGKGDHSDHDDDNGSRWLPDLSNWLD